MDGWLAALSGWRKRLDKTFSDAAAAAFASFPFPTLDRNQELQHVGVGRPGLCALAAPGAQERDAHLAVLVEVRIEAVGAVTVVVADGRRLRVVGGELEIEEEETVLVGGSRRTRDHDRVEVLQRGRGAEPEVLKGARHSQAK